LGKRRDLEAGSSDRSVRSSVREEGKGMCDTRNV